MGAISKKLVIFVLPSMAGGGAERVASIILNNIDRNRYTPKLVLFNKKGEYLESLSKNIEILDLGKRSRWHFFKLILQLRAIIRKDQPSIVVSFLEYANIITVLSGLYLKGKTRIIISERNYHRAYLPYERMRMVKKALMYFTYRRAHRIIAISEGIKRSLVQDFRIDINKINVIYNPIDVKKVQYLSKQDCFHPFFGIKEKKVVIIQVGRLTLQKNHALMIHALSYIRKELPAYLIILGQGELEENLKKMVKQLNLENYVDFVGFKKNPFTWMAKSDLFVLSSSWEGFGNVIIEAMACGVPVISTNCPTGPGEIITDGVNGLLVPVDDLSALTGAILRLLKDEPLRKRLAEAGKKRSEDLRIEKILTEYEKVFEEVVVK